ncbi:MAG: tripartite tricarboxylate transporter substrate binding protein [Betaproteobacteria bacterium]
MIRWTTWMVRVTCVGLAFGVSTAAGAQSYLKFVVGGPPGGLFDIVLRIISDRVERDLGRTLVIENKPGAGGAVALESVRSAKADGLTVGMINVAAAANEAIIKGKAYNLLTDFEPVGMYVFPVNVLIVNPEMQATSVTAFISLLKARGTTNYSSGGIGSPGHLAGEMFKAKTGAPATHVPYKGAPPAVLAVVTGETSYMFATASSAIAQIDAKKVRALAVTTNERLPQLPDVPTMLEAGLVDFNVSDWAGFVLPKGTPTDARDALHAALSAAFADPQIKERLRKATFVPMAKPLGPKEFGAFLQAEVDKWGTLVRATGIRQE